MQEFHRHIYVSPPQHLMQENWREVKVGSVEDGRLGPHTQGISWTAHKPSPLWSLVPCQALLKSHTHELFPGIRTYWEVPAAGWN